MTAINGHTPTSDVHQQLAETKARCDLALAQARLSILERKQKRLKESWEWSDSWGGGALGLLARVRDNEGRDLVAPFDVAHFRAYGANWPFWRTWTEHARLRADSRFLATTNNTATGVLQALCSFIIGEGYTYRCAPKKEGLGIPDDLTDYCQHVLDDFHEANQWGELEQELFIRSRRDGETFLRHFINRETGEVVPRVIEPAEVIETGLPREIASFGILNPPDDVETHTGYLVSYTGMVGDVENDGKGVPAAEVVHCKVNVDRRVKRGMPDFAFGTHDLIRTAARALENMGEATADQAAISEIVQHQTASRDQVQEFVDSMGDIELPDVFRAGGVQEMRIRRPGTRLDIDKGQEYVTPPFSANVPGYVEATGAVLRSAAVRWNAPEWITSGDASNNNYASSLTAENPFVKTGKRWQIFYKRPFLRTHWMVLEEHWRARGGSVKIGGRSWDWETVKRVVDIQAEAPMIEWRNKQEQASTDQTYVSLGVKSRQTVAQEQNLSWDHEQANIEEYNERFGEPGVELGIPGEPDHLDITGEPPIGLGGSGAGGSGGSGKGGKGGPVQQELEVLKAKVGLLGPIGVIQKQVYAGEMPRSAGIATLTVMLGLERQQAEALLPQEQAQNLTADGGGAPEQTPAPPDQAAESLVRESHERIARRHGEDAARAAILAAADLIGGR